MLRPAGRDLQTVPTSGNVSLVRAYRSDYNTAVHVYLSSNASRGARLTEQQIGSSLRNDHAELCSSGRHRGFKLLYKEAMALRKPLDMCRYVGLGDVLVVGPNWLLGGGFPVG